MLSESSKTSTLFSSLPLSPSKKKQNKKRKTKLTQLPGLGRPMPGGGMHRPGDAAAAAIAAAEGN
jgi:hypothetical protein